LNVNIGWYICIFKGLYKSITDFGIKLILSDHFLYSLCGYSVCCKLEEYFFFRNEFFDGVVVHSVSPVFWTPYSWLLGNEVLGKHSSTRT